MGTGEKKKKIVAFDLFFLFPRVWSLSYHLLSFISITSLSRFKWDFVTSSRIKGHDSQGQQANQQLHTRTRYNKELACLSFLWLELLFERIGDLEGTTARERHTTNRKLANRTLNHEGRSFLMCGGTRNIILRTLPPYTQRARLLRFKDVQME